MAFHDAEACFSGNIDPTLYSDVALERWFGVSPRFTILDAVKDVIEWRDSRTNPIPMDQWRPTLAGHDFSWHFRAW